MQPLCVLWQSYGSLAPRHLFPTHTGREADPYDIYTTNFFTCVRVKRAR